MINAARFQAPPEIIDLTLSSDDDEPPRAINTPRQPRLPRKHAGPPARKPTAKRQRHEDPPSDCLPLPVVKGVESLPYVSETAIKTALDALSNTAGFNGGKVLRAVPWSRPATTVPNKTPPTALHQHRRPLPPSKAEQSPSRATRPPTGSKKRRKLGPSTAPEVHASDGLGSGSGNLERPGSCDPISSPPSNRTWPQLRHRPYLCAAGRRAITRGVTTFRPQSAEQLPLPATFHIDFDSLELAELVKSLEQGIGIPVPRTKDGLLHILSLPDHVSALTRTTLPGRSQEDIANFCRDLTSGQLDNGPPQVLTLEKAASPETRAQNHRQARTTTLLLARELEGNAGFGRMRQYENFQNQFRVCHEDSLSTVAEFTNCAGDISTISWVPEGRIICGTTAHSDTHNQQYNKPGNLLLCSTKRGVLQAFADHRIPRPTVEKGQNSTEAMRQSQDPWLYSSVVSSDYDTSSGLAFTSSFDKTVKAWGISTESMTAVATWRHEGNVNFVAAAKDGSGRIATAADVSSAAIRIYQIDQDDIQNSSYYSVSCTRNDDEPSGKWAFFPSTMQWGIAPGTQHLLAIGYSPRSFTIDETDIPQDKLHSGEIILWDAQRRRRVPVLTGSTANVFEVLWHPTLPRFIAATSPSGLIVEPHTRTQIHLFQVDPTREDGGYSEVQSLDCPASDINAVTIMPNSLRHAYITAACTDGRVYVYDTAQGDAPVHVLRHGEPLDDFAFDREKEDTGVTFTAWGTTADRLYTGSSDGAVKVWNIRRTRRPFIRTVLEAPGPISCGVFSPDHAKLAIGDSTGRLFLLSIDKRDEIEAHFTTLPDKRRVRRPTPFTPHAEPPPPRESQVLTGTSSGDSSIAQYAREKYLDTFLLRIHENPVIGVVQGPLYFATTHFRLEAHSRLEPLAPLLPEFERRQQCTQHASLGTRRRSMRRLKAVPDAGDAKSVALHRSNTRQDLDVASLSSDLMEELVRCGARLNLDGEEGWQFPYEEMPADTDEDHADMDTPSGPAVSPAASMGVGAQQEQTALDDYDDDDDDDNDAARPVVRTEMDMDAHPSKDSWRVR